MIDVYNKFITSALAVNTKGEVVETDAAKVFAVDMASEIKKPLENQVLPIFTATLENGETAFIFPLRGKGLWGPVWGYISLKTDYNTVLGTMFDHKGETPVWVPRSIRSGLQPCLKAKPFMVTMEISPQSRSSKVELPTTIRTVWMPFRVAQSPAKGSKR